MNLFRKNWVALALAGAVGVGLAGKLYLESPPPMPPVTVRPPASHPRPEPGTDVYASYSQVEEGLFVGGRVSRPPPGIQAVLCLSGLDDPYREKVARWNKQSISDGSPAPSLAWLERQVEFVAGQRREGLGVYVHCDAGVSRGPMVMTAYLMREHKWGRDRALAFLRERRRVVYPNRFFMALLLEWEETMREQIAPEDRSVVTTQSGAASAVEGSVP